MADIKWSAFPTQATPVAGDTLVGLHSGANVQFSSLGAVLLSSGSSQTISGGFDLIVSGAGNLQASSGNLVGGSSGFAGNVILFPPTSGRGILEVHASDSAAMFTGLLTNASLSAGRTWTLPDSSGTIALTSGASGIVNSSIINRLAWYANSGSTVSGLVSNANGLLVTNGTAVPSIGNTIGATITVTGNVQASSPTNPAGFISFSPTGLSGSLYLNCQDNTGNFRNILTNASTTAARIWTLPDATGTIALTSGGGLQVATISGTTQSAAVNTQYIALNSSQTTLTLPAVYAVGDVVGLIGATANTGGWVIAAAAGDTIQVNNATTSSGGTVTCTAVAGQCIEIICDVDNASWVMTSTSSVLLTTA